MNLSVLFIFKYLDFAIDTLNKVLSVVGEGVSNPMADLLLPVGISFYTFQALSYTIDVYRGDIYAERNFLKYALYISFFPQLVAGPIEWSKNILKQINERHYFQAERVRDGLLLMVWGYFLKLVLAERIAVIVDTVYEAPEVYSGWYIIVASVLFAFQIYCDFAGYSTIAIGAAQVMGFRLMNNFDCPYFARSVAEFWRRWHISLTSWFRDYLYIPLGGNRKGTARKYLNIMIVFLVSGLWHGAQWSFVIWGGLNGLYQVMGSILSPVRSFLKEKCKIDDKLASHKLLKVMGTFVLVDFAWIFFRANSFGQSVAVIKSMLHLNNIWILFDGSLYQLGLSQKSFWVMMAALFLLFCVDYLKYRGIAVRETVARQGIWLRWGIYLAAVYSVLIFGIWGGAYEASNFIYFQF